MVQKTKEKFVVVDTSALMHFPEVLKCGGCLFFIPLTVIRQLDGLKNDDERGNKSRQASRCVEAGQKEQKVIILNRYVPLEGVKNKSDNKIVGAAVQLAQDNPGRNIVLLTTDRNMRLVANGYGIEAVDFDGLPEIKSLARLPLRLHVMVWIAIVLMTAFPIFRNYFGGKHAVIGEYVAFLGFVVFVIWVGLVAEYKRERLPGNRRQYQYDVDGVTSVYNIARPWRPGPFHWR